MLSDMYLVLPPNHPLQEEKEEIRRMNQMILHSKCMAARDLQVAEKAATHVQAAEEERRVVEEMEARRKAALAELEVGMPAVLGGEQMRGW